MKQPAYFRARINTIRQLIEENGGIVTGQVPNFSVSIPTPVGQVAGSCRLVEGSLVNLTVTKKPEFMTCTMVRDKLVFFITEAVKMYAMQTAPVS